MSFTIFAVHVGQTEIAARVSVSQLGVIHAELIEQRRVQVVNRDAVLHGLEAELVGGAVGEAALEAAACHEHREAVRIVIAAVAAFGDRRAAEFAAPDHQRFVQQSRGASDRE